MKKIKILFVCMGNICRSPTAEGVFTRLLVDQHVANYFEIDSAGTHAYHVGDAPDLRAQRAASARGIDLSTLRARKVIRGDFEDFDYILAMDDDNYSILIHACPSELQHKIRYFMEFAPHLNCREVPDPYYGGQYGFEKVLDLSEAAAFGLLKAINEERKLNVT